MNSRYNEASQDEVQGCQGSREGHEYLAERPHRVEELLERFRTDLGVTWETDAQINFRLGWLENLGVAESYGDSWQLTSKT